jgi:hypothetical protein
MSLSLFPCLHRKRVYVYVPRACTLPCSYPNPERIGEGLVIQGVHRLFLDVPANAGEKTWLWWSCLW